MGFSSLLKQPISCRIAPADRLCSAFRRTGRRLCKVMSPKSIAAARANLDTAQRNLFDRLKTISCRRAADRPSLARSQPSSNPYLLICSLLIASPFAPKKFLKQFTALLRKHTAVDIATMI